ncbi:MAG: hypothetical protein BMS9Abin37_3039 [Acidobacteriota bacterium]|nr:MAG: hypothetical protein BMS9Abin37_3039 [Acidobacteriota bacterium]
MLDFAPLRLCPFALVLSSGCAQPPDDELVLAANRVEALRSVDAATFAPEPLGHAELALATARSLTEDGSYLPAIHAAAETVMHADDAFDLSTSERSIAERHFERCLHELEGLMAIAGHRGADAEAPSELEAFAERYRSVKSTADGGDLLAALEQARQLKPELLAFEQRFRE